MKDNKEQKSAKETKNPEDPNAPKENNPAEENNENKEEVQNPEENPEENPENEQAEEKKSKADVDLNSVKSENLYTEEIITKLQESPDTRRDTIIQLYGKLFKSRGEKMKSNQMKAIINFHCQNLDFILEKFKTYPVNIITKLANIFSLLLNLKEEENNIQLKTKNMEQGPEDNTSKFSEIPEPDFGYIINKKIMEIKSAFIKFKLFPDPKNPPAISEKNFYLNNKELEIVLSHLNECYFPFIRLFYHVINLNRIETKKMHSLNKPLAIPNMNDDENAPEKFIIEEQVKRPTSNEKNIDEKISEGIEIKYCTGDAAQMGGEQGQKGDYATEVRKLITEKVDELRKDVDAKISENEFEVERNIQSIKEQYLPPNKKK